jgi:hypothetical protein
MPEYRLYVMTKDGHIDRVPATHDLPNDKVAIEKGRQLLDGRTVEVWQGARLVAHLGPDKKAV